MLATVLKVTQCQRDVLNAYTFTMKTYAQGHRWTKVSCLEFFSIDSARVYDLVSNTNYMKCNVSIIDSFRERHLVVWICCSLEAGCRLQKYLLRHQFYGIWHVWAEIFRPSTHQSFIYNEILLRVIPVSSNTFLYER